MDGHSDRHGRRKLWMALGAVVVVLAGILLLVLRSCRDRAEAGRSSGGGAVPSSSLSSTRATTASTGRGGQGEAGSKAAVAPTTTLSATSTTPPRVDAPAAGEGKAAAGPDSSAPPPSPGGGGEPAGGAANPPRTASGGGGGSGAGVKSGAPDAPLPKWSPTRKDQDLWEAAVRTVRQRLKNPSTARFPAAGAPGTSVRSAGADYVVEAYVDAQDSSGQAHRSRFSCHISPRDGTVHVRWLSEE